MWLNSLSFGNTCTEPGELRYREKDRLFIRMHVRKLRRFYFYDNTSLIVLKIKIFLDNSCRENKNIFLFSNDFPKIVPFVR
jgi:hypothetical protein